MTGRQVPPVPPVPPVGRRVVATAPVRVADVGGWTDTWFAGHGAVCSVAVGPGARAEVEVVARRPGDGPVRIHAPDLGASWAVDPDPSYGWVQPGPGCHPLLEHAVRAGLAADPGLGDGVSLEVTVSAAVPPGSSVGSSASVLVALLAALGAALGRPFEPDAVARLAHRAETVGAGRQSGVQDHVAAAHGGVSWIEVDPYPAWHWDAVEVPAPLLGALGRRLLTVHLGGGHDSSALHRSVIARAEAGDPAVAGILEDLRGLAEEARRALRAGDADRWGGTLSAATEAQAALHPELVGPEARAVIDLGAHHGATGAKVNGAGGAGGSVTVLAPADEDSAAGLRHALDADGWTVLPLSPAPGVHVEVDDPR